MQILPVPEIVRFPFLVFEPGKRFLSSAPPDLHEIDPAESDAVSSLQFAAVHPYIVRFPVRFSVVYRDDHSVHLYVFVLLVKGLYVWDRITIP